MISWLGALAAGARPVVQTFFGLVFLLAASTFLLLLVGVRHAHIGPSRNIQHPATNVSVTDARTTKTQSSDSDSFATRIATFFGRSAAEPKLDSGKPSTNVNGSEAVQSWSQFLESAKARIEGVERKWLEANPEGSKSIRFQSQDVKRTDSLINPIIGEAVLLVRSDYGPNSVRDLVMEQLVAHERVINSSYRTAVETGQTARLKDLKKQGDDIRAEIEKRRKESTRLYKTCEFKLQFAFKDSGWHFCGGTCRVTESSIGDNRISEAVPMGTLDDELRLLFP